MSAQTTAAGGTSAPPAVALDGINKSFGPVHANKNIDLAVEPGTIHGIIGENGAGKSTLMNILYGFYQADSGTILVDGEVRAIESPEDAIKAGIGMVHQHFMLVEPFSVLENILLGAEGGWTLKAGKEKAREELLRLERDYALEVDIDARVADLPVGIQQRVEILKALFRGAHVLILDEPTGVLTPQEADHLFRILGSLKAQGRTVILITHKLREIMAVTDNVSVMRAGEMVAHRPTAETTTEELAELMVGRKVLLRVDKRPAKPDGAGAGRRWSRGDRRARCAAGQGCELHCSGRRDRRNCGCRGQWPIGAARSPVRHPQSVRRARPAAWRAHTRCGRCQAEEARSRA